MATRRREIVFLAVQKKPENLPRLKKATKDPDWQVRHAAVDGVGRLGREGDPLFLIDVLKNTKEEPKVRAAAVARLGDMRYWDAGPAILDAMEDASDIVRARAGVALRRLITVDFEYRANDPPGPRMEKMRKIRELWPWFYDRFSGEDKAKG